MINFDRDQIVMSIPNPKQQSCQSYHFQIGFLFVKIGSIKSKFYIKDFFDKIFFSVELKRRQSFDVCQDAVFKVGI